MKITIRFEEFKNAPIILGEEFIKAGWNFTQNNEKKYFEIVIDNAKEWLEFYKILVNN